jgi:Flp pilus assembly protein CpaB
LACGQDLGGVAVSADGRYRKDEQSAGSSPLITLALTPQEASLIAFVQEQGKIRLTLRSPADSRVEMVLPASWDTLFQHIMPPQAKTDAAAQQGQAPREIEIYRGLKKESLSLSRQ